MRKWESVKDIQFYSDPIHLIRIVNWICLVDCCMALKITMHSVFVTKLMATVLNLYHFVMSIVLISLCWITEVIMYASFASIST